jgi:hypothetical protein
MQGTPVRLGRLHWVALLLPALLHYGLRLFVCLYHRAALYSILIMLQVSIKAKVLCQAHHCTFSVCAFPAHNHCRRSELCSRTCHMWPHIAPAPPWHCPSGTAPLVLPLWYCPSGTAYTAPLALPLLLYPPSTPSPYARHPPWCIRACTACPTPLPVATAARQEQRARQAAGHLAHDHGHVQVRTHLLGDGKIATW